MADVSPFFFQKDRVMTKKNYRDTERFMVLGFRIQLIVKFVVVYPGCRWRSPAEIIKTVRLSKKKKKKTAFIALCL